VIQTIDRLDRMTPSNATAYPYAIDAGVSRLTVRAFATGLLSAFGHDPVVGVHTLSGEAHLAEGTLEQAALYVTVNVGSLTIENDANDKDRREMQRAMYAEVLEGNDFPEISYDCSRISGSSSGEGQFMTTLDGELTLHGATRSARISARVFVTGDLLRASGEFTLQMSDYQIKPVSAVAGGLRLKAEIRITFEVVARKQT